MLCFVGCYGVGLGHTVPELGIEKECIFQKTRFSMLTPDVEKYIRECRSKCVYGMNVGGCAIMSTWNAHIYTHICTLNVC